MKRNLPTRSRTKLLVSALVASAAMIGAVPAQAQSYPQHYPQSHDGRYDDRDGRYDSRYDRDHSYRGNANAIWTQRESRYLQDRINQIRSRLHYERRDSDGRRW